MTLSIMEKYYKSKFENHIFMNLGAETNLQSYTHTKGRQHSHG